MKQPVGFRESAEQGFVQINSKFLLVSGDMYDARQDLVIRGNSLWNEHIVE